MISALKGIVVEKYPDSVLIDVNGIVFSVSIPFTTYEKLLKEGEEEILYTYLVHREDRMELFGFKEKESLEIFKTLIGVNGVGPKTALSILSKLSADRIKKAVSERDTDTFKGISGIGIKTAEKIIFELKDKFKEITWQQKEIKEDEVSVELRMALQSLGYTSSEIEKVIRNKELRDALSLEERIKIALKFLLSGRRL